MGELAEEVRCRPGLAEGLSPALQNVARPLLKNVEGISEQLAVYDQKIEEIAKRYPEVELLTPVYGVGTLIALTYILTLEDAQRFAHSGTWVRFWGYSRNGGKAGKASPNWGSSKTGDGLMRSLLVQGHFSSCGEGARRFTRLGTQQAGQWGQEREAADGGGGGSEAGGVAAHAMGEWASIRSVVQPQGGPSCPGQSQRKRQNTA